MCVYITKDQVGVVYIQAAPDVSMKACIENNNNKSFFGGIRILGVLKGSSCCRDNYCPNFATRIKHVKWYLAKEVVSLTYI